MSGKAVAAPPTDSVELDDRGDDLRRVSGGHSGGAAARAGRRRRHRQPDAEAGDGGVRSGRDHRAAAGRRRPRRGLRRVESRRPTRMRLSRRRQLRPTREFRAPAAARDRERRDRRRRDDRVDAADGRAPPVGAGHAARGRADPLMQWTSRVAVAARFAAIAPALFVIDPRAARVAAARPDAVRHGLGRPRVLRPRVGQRCATAAPT